MCLPTGGALLLASLACCLLAVRRRNKIHKAQQSLAMAKGPYDPAHSTPTQRGGLTGWLFGHTSAASSGVVEAFAKDSLHGAGSSSSHGGRAFCLASATVCVITN